MSSSPSKVRRPWSLTVRLVGLQVFAVALLNCGGYFFLLQSISRDLDADNRDDLDHQAALLKNWLESPNVTPTAITDQINAPAGGRIATQLFVARILDVQGGVLHEAKNRQIPPLSAFPAIGGPPAHWHAPGGPHYLVTCIWIDLGYSHQRAQVQIAFDVSDDFTLIRRIRQYTMIAFGLLLLASTGLALWITHRGLRPLATLADSAARVQASRLNSRLDETVWPVELVPVVREFDAMLGRLDGSFRRLIRFSSDLSHELRTPINNLRGEAEVALNRPRTVEEYRAVLESSLEEFARVTRLIDTLLFIAKADQPESSLKRQQLEAVNECRAVVDFFEAACAECGLTVLVRGQASIYCDSDLFRRALSNLVDNALRHTPSGGHIDLIVRAGAFGGTEVEVSDSGTGIATEHLPHVFERFYQAARHDTDATSSSFGLGLAIVKSIMDLHGGQVAIASVPDRGTTITLSFPGPAVSGTTI